MHTYMNVINKTIARMRRMSLFDLFTLYFGVGYSLLYTYLIILK